MAEIHNDNPEIKSSSPEKSCPEPAKAAEGDKEKLSPQENEATKPNKENSEKNDTTGTPKHPKLEANNNGINNDQLEGNKHPVESNAHGKLSPEQPTEHTPEQPTEHTPEQPKEHTPEQPKEHTPEQPKEHAPEQPKEHTPEQPKEHTPEQPKEYTPEQPKEHTPEQPKEHAPEQPKEHTPEQPKEHTPEQPNANGYNLDSTIPADSKADWMNPEDRAYLNDLYSSGELEPTINYSSEEPQEPSQHLPTEKTGHFDGERGNSTFHPNDSKAQDVLQQYGQDGVNYSDGNPDFTPFCRHDSPWGNVDSNVKIGHMTDQRANPTFEYGRRADAHSPTADLGNFSQADNSLADKLNESYPDLDLSGKDIEKWRTGSGLTWHECADGETMQLIPTDLHDACRHSGGVSEQKYAQAMGNYWPDELDNPALHSK